MSSRVKRDKPATIQKRDDIKLPQAGKEKIRCATCEEYREATLYCKDCDEYFCDECDSGLHRVGIMKKHERAKVSIVRQKRECPLHKESKLSLYCETERKFCCPMCCFEEMHKGHKIVKISDAEKGIQVDQKEVLDDLKTAIESASNMSKKLVRKLGKIDENLRDVRKKIDFTEAALCDYIKSSMEKLRNDMESEVSETKENITDRIEKLNGVVESARSLVNCVETNGSGEGPYANLWNISEMIKMTQQLTDTEVEKLESVHFNYLVSVDEEKEKLKSLVDKFIVSKKTVSTQPKYPINFEEFTKLKSSPSTIITGGTSSSYGSVFDQKRRIVVSITGQNNYKTNLKLTTLTGNGNNLKCNIKNIEGVIPFDSTNCRPIYDGNRYIYFTGSNNNSYNIFGRINMDRIESREFEMLPNLPDKGENSKRSFSSPSAGVYHFGKIYIMDSEYKLWRFSISDNKWTELNIRIPNRANLLSNGIKDDTIYALVEGQKKLCEINIKICSITWRISECNYSYNFGGLLDSFLINTGYDDFIVITNLYYYYSGASRYYYYWYAYSYAEDKWINLNQWEQHRSRGNSLFFDPTTYRLIYHINGKDTWESVDLTSAKIKDKKLYIEERK